MCHVVLMMPVLGLSLFAFLPMNQALPIYAILFLVSLVLYVEMMKVSRQPAMNGLEGLLGERGRVRRIDADGVRVFVHGEVWHAKAEDAVNVGDAVVVTGFEGMTLLVARAGQRGSGNAPNVRPGANL